MSIFEEAVQLAGEAADDVMGEAFELTPMMRGPDNGPDVADFVRAASYRIVAHLRDPEAKPQIPDSYDARQFRRPGVETGSPYLKVSASEMGRQLRADGAFEIRAADVLTRFKDGTRWRAAAAFAMAAGALRVTVNLIGGP